MAQRSNVVTVNNFMGGPYITIEEFSNTLTTLLTAHKQWFQSKITMPNTPSPVPPIFVYGPPGVGKTQVITTLGAELGYDVRVMIASTMDPVEVRGIPVPIIDQAVKYPNSPDGFTVWMPDQVFKRSVDRPVIYFFDELNLAPPAVQAALYRLILEGKLEKIDISMHVRIGAGNERNVVPNANPLTVPLETRFAVYYVRPDAEAWLTWAKKNGVDSRVINYLSTYKDQIYHIDTMNMTIAKATPRGWERVSNLLKLNLTSKYDIASSVGFRIADDFMRYLETVKPRITPESAVSGWLKGGKPEKGKVKKSEGWY
ncbi:MAG: AAA family ATPase [Thermoprotei archaeon]